MRILKRMDNCMGSFLNEEKPVVLGVDIGATKILVGYVESDGIVPLSRRYVIDRSNRGSTIASIKKAITDFLEIPWSMHPPLAIGVGLPGLINATAGTWEQATNLPITSPVNLAAQLIEIYKLPVALDNDVHAATLAELHLGAGLQTRDFIYLNVGTGISTGIVCNGQLVRGANNCAGEFGHTSVDMNGVACECGGHGCLEPIASGGGILAQIRTLLPAYPTSSLGKLLEPDQLTASLVFHAADNGDSLAIEVSERAVKTLGFALINLITLLNPSLIICGGGVMADGWMIRKVDNYIATHALPFVYQSLHGIVLSELKADQVGLLGASILAWKSIGKT